MALLLSLLYLLTTQINAECNYVATDNGDGTPHWGTAKAPGYCFGAQSEYPASYKYICDGEDFIYRQYPESQTCDEGSTYYDTRFEKAVYSGNVLWNCAGQTCVLNYRQYTWDCPWDSNNCSETEIITAEDNCDVNSIYAEWYEEAGIPGKCTSGERSFFISCNANSKAIITEMYESTGCSGGYQMVEYASQSCATPGLYYDVYECDLGSPTQPTTTTLRPTTRPTNRPTTADPTISPTTPYPTLPSVSPTTSEPTAPTIGPTKRPTKNPTDETVSPSKAPSEMTDTPTEKPTERRNSNGVESMRFCIVCLLLPLLYIVCKF